MDSYLPKKNLTKVETEMYGILSKDYARDFSSKELLGVGAKVQITGTRTDCFGIEQYAIYCGYDYYFKRPDFPISMIVDVVNVKII